MSGKNLLRIVRLAAGAALCTLLAAGLTAPPAAAASTSIDPSPACATNTLARNDDGSSSQVTLPFPVNFFGNSHNSLYVNNNGNVTFDAPLVTYTPFGLTKNISTPIIAPFFADIDTRAAGSDQVTYGASADGKTFCVDWGGTNGVGYYDTHSDKLVRAQLELIDRSGDPGGVSGDFDIVMNYGTVNWETGDASDGSGGLGGETARAGYSAGTGADGTFFEFAGSGTSGAFLDSAATGLIHSSRNSTQDGRYVFRVRAGAVPVGAGVSGTVYAGSATPANVVGNAFVQVCPLTVTSRGCNTSSTNSNGGYQVGGLPNGSYRVTAYPPASSHARPASREVTIAGGVDVTGQDLVLDVPLAMPTGTTLTNLSINPDGLPVVYWGDPLTLQTHGCAGAGATYTLTQGTVTLRSGSLTESPSGTYTTVIAALRPVTGYARLTITLTCPGGAVTNIPFDVYIDPSGTVVDTAGNPVVGATVTLFRSDDLGGPFTQVPDGSGLMSVANRRNPATTIAGGHFGWDVVAGFYRVRAARAGCVSSTDPSVAYAETSVLTIPPPVTDLRLVLSCTSQTLNHPPVAPDRTATTTEGKPVTVDVLTGTSDPDGDTVSFVSATAAVGGAVSCSTTGSCVYTPNPDFNGAGSFTYTVGDGKGGTATGNVKITVSKVNTAPTAAFSASPTAGAAPLSVSFDASSSVDVEGIAGYGWAFGDGTSGTGKAVSHLYSVAGTYHVVLTVTDTSGATDIATGTITVNTTTPPASVDSLGMDRYGSLRYTSGGPLTSGDFVVTRRSGTVRSITGTGLVGTYSVTFDISVVGGRGYGTIVVKDTTRGRVFDRISVLGSELTVRGNTISARSVWGPNIFSQNRLLWSITDTHV